MKNNAGLIAALTIFMAFFGISSLPKNAPNSSGVASEGTAKFKTSAKSSRTTESPESVGCKEIGVRLQPFASELLTKDSALPESCYTDGKPSRKLQATPRASNLQFVIATAPNPISTHLSLMFDRMIEVIQQAAQDDNYSYDSSWFPWNDTSKDSAPIEDQRDVARAPKIHQHQPGIIVFRRALLTSKDDSPYRGGLVVFLVAEQPTGGINREEFENALAWIEQLGALSPQQGLKILGPTFSGSLPSLAAALRSTKLKSFGGQEKIRISSGSVSSDLSYHWFQRFLKRDLEFFKTAQESDSLMVKRFYKYLEGQGYPLDRIAMVSEDETAFGGNTDRDGDSDKGPHPIFLYYPRDIATLRSAYEQQSIFNSGKPPANGGTATTTLRSDLSEPNNSDYDTVRSYGGQLSPLAQESVLTSITSVLKEKQIQFVVLRSTNSLDQIFLTQFLRRSYPGARIVIDGADLLFQRGAEGTSLRGVMMLSSYPMFTQQQDWSPSFLNQNTGAYRLFGQDIAAGLYVAARDLFRDSREGRDTQVSISNYAPPAWAAAQNSEDQTSRRPSTWVSVIGHHQFWPVAVLNQDTLGGKADNDTSIAATRGVAEQGGAEKVFPGDAEPLRLDSGLVVLLVVCLAWAVLHWVACKRGSIAPFPSLFRLAYFAPIPREQHPALIAFASILPALAATITAGTTGLFTWSLVGWRGSILAVWTFSVVLLSCLACRSNYQLRTISGGFGGEATFVMWRRRYAALAVALYAFLVLLHLNHIGALTLANRIPAYWRSAHLLSGVSPLLPQLLLLGGMYLWLWFSLRGLALFGDDRPVLPKLDSLPTLSPEDRTPIMPMFSREYAAEPLESKAIPAGKRYLWLLGASLFVTFCVFGLMLEDVALRTLGERRFGITMFCWLSVCIAMVLADTLQLWITWRELRSLLVYLNRLPLRRTLASLSGLSWESVWAMSSDTLEERYRVISRQFESLQHLRNVLKLGHPGDSCPGIENRTAEALASIDSCQEKGRNFVQWYVKLKDQNLKGPNTNINPLCEFQNALAATASSVLKDLLYPAWQRETQSLILDGLGANAPDDKTEDDRREKEQPEGKEKIAHETTPAHTAAAEEFVVLPYLAFVQNILGRMRTIVLGSLFLFVAATCAVSSYPFDPMPVLGGIFLVVFAITGGAVILVFAQMHRDATLSYITNTRPGELGTEFWLHLTTFGIGPLLGLLTTLFPSITDFVASWLQPGMQSLK